MDKVKKRRGLPPDTHGSILARVITRGNSGNGALLTLKRKNVGDKNIEMTI